MATQVFTNFEGQSKSEFDTISVKTINLENYCGSYKLDASAFCQLQDKVSEAYCKAVSAFEEAEKAYCAASGSGSTDASIPIISYADNPSKAYTPPQCERKCSYWI